MQDGRAYKQYGQHPYGAQHIINIAYALIFNIGVYGDACKEWEKQDILEKTWDNFKAHFPTEHRLYRKQRHTAQASRFYSSNHAQRGLQDTLLIEQSEALAMMTTASAAYRGTMSHLVTTSAQLSKHLAKKSAALAAANEIILSSRAASRPTGGGATASDVLTPNSARSSNGTARARSVTTNENYCWSHGYQMHADHNSMTCTR
jgi:hypothetical protein